MGSEAKARNRHADEARAKEIALRWKDQEMRGKDEEIAQLGEDMTSLAVDNSRKEKEIRVWKESLSPYF